MNSFLTRLNSLSAFTLTVVGCVTFLCFLTTAFKDRYPASSPVIINFSSSQPTTVRKVRNIVPGPPEIDFVDAHLNIEADFSELFDWNTKELFVYAVATYNSPTHPINEVVLWDKIILRNENPKVDLLSATMEYPFYDYGLGLRGNSNVSLWLCWNVIPFAGGQLQTIKSQRHRIVLPEKYTIGK